jgi:putative transposase
MTKAARARYAGYRFPAEIISHAVWLYFRFPLGLRMVEELLAARGIIVSHETVRQWARKFGQQFANRIRRRLPRVGDKWHLDEVVLKIAGVKHWLWRAVDQTGIVLDVLVQRRRDKQAAKRLLRKLLKKQMRPPRVMITDKLASYGAAKREIMPGIEHRQHKGLEQHSGELAPTDAPTRAPNEAVQIGRPGAALPLSPRPDQQSLPPPPRSRHCCGAQSLQEPNVPGLGRNLQHGLAINLNPPIPIACIPLTDLTS